MRNYTDEMMGWLATNVPCAGNWQALTTRFNERFGKTHTLNRLKTHCNRHGLFITGEALGGKKCWNEKPIGHVCNTNNGYARVKTEHGYKMLSHEIIGEVKRNEAVVHLNGDKEDFRADNLMILPKAAIRRFQIEARWNPGFMSADAEIRKAAYMVCELEVMNENGRSGYRV